MAQATTNAAIEAVLHASITKEAAENKISFSEQVSRYRVQAHIKMHMDAQKVARIEENRQQKVRKEQK